MTTDPSDAPGSPKERILSAARQVFSARGYRGGSLNDVAVLAGYTRAGLLHHYPSKESILLAMLEERDQHVAEITPEEDEKIGIVELMRRLCDTTDVVLRDPELVQIAHVLTAEASGGDHPARDWVAHRQERFRGILTRAVQRSIDSEELPTGIDPATLAAVIYGVFEGLEAQWLIDPSVDPRAGHRAVLDLLRRISAKPLPTSR